FPTYYCITINSELHGRNSIKLSHNRVFKLEIGKPTWNVYKAWWLYFHHYTDRPASWDWNAVKLYVTYQLKSYRLLRAPYATNCKDYHAQTQFQSRRDCVRKCIINVGFEKCGAYPYYVDIYNLKISTVKYTS
ncbi:unnamed protein product, partial [Oppiella nova]